MILGIPAPASTVRDGAGAGVYPVPTLRAEEGEGGDAAAEGETTDPGGELGRILRERRDAQDAAAAELEKALKATADRLAEGIQGYLEGRAGGTDGAKIRAAIYQTRLEDLLALLDDLGLADAEDDWYRRYAELAGMAEETLGAVGIDDADRMLDGEGAQAALTAYLEGDRDGFWETDVARPSAQRILQGLRTSIEAQPLSEVIQVIARDEGTSVSGAVTLARTRIAEYDRFANAEASRQADPDGETLMWAYTGPDDGLERPFCQEVNGFVFTRALVGGLDNHQPGTGHPMVGGGGWNCRHQWVHGTVEFLEGLGYRQADQGRVDAANAAAAGGRK